MLGQNDVRRSGKILKVQPETEPEPVEDFAHRHFRTGVGATHRTHDPTSNRLIISKVAHGLHSLKDGTGPGLSDFKTLRVFGPGEELPQPMIAAMWNWPGLRRKRWTVVQESVFGFLFSRGCMADDPPLYCFINLADTLLAIVACPPPLGKPAGRRLRAKP